MGDGGPHKSHGPPGSPARTGVPEVPYGTVVGNDYMVVRPLNRGSMGALYVAEQLSTASLRALKVLRREYVSDPTLYKRFEREAQVAARIPSEHVAQTIAAGVDRKLDVPWIAMELLEGQNLRDYVDERGPMPKDEVREHLEQLCHALAAAHKLGIVHRDLKPANVFLSEAKRVGAQRVVKVLDFGIAKILAESVTLQGAPLGTANWMAPEQTIGDPATTATDVWALGLLAFYMLTGRSFWRGSQKPDNDVGVMHEILHDPIPIAWTRAIELGVSDKIPDGFNEWFAQCVARRPEDRFVSAAPAYAALASALT
ncbi:MAG: serine/threonine protein kinase [Labilithrix sp.]|nr:serine/threonine protein kinase [Labilithrix sp.]MBX3221546.1 serine/threonine protein kinase [Labilithrix sp.]